MTRRAIEPHLAVLRGMPVHRCKNRLFEEASAYPDELRQFLSHAAAGDAFREISSWSGYEPTPLVELTDLAAEAQIEQLYYKDEGGRFGLGSFKALGGAYAVAKLQAGLEPAAAGDAAVPPLTVCCATDGNHGRSVAWGAQRAGCRCVIYLHAGVSKERERAIAAYGAEIRRVEGNYDDSVRAAEKDAGENGWVVVSDTSYPGYTDIPCTVMQGYTVMLREIADAGVEPTHVFVQGGVGGLAAAVCADLWQAYGTTAPKIVVVEPAAAACLFQSACAGHPVAIHGALDTLMAGLACGEVSEIAWRILSRGASHFLTIPDEAAVETMRLLACGTTQTKPIVAGESATAGLAALLALSSRADAREDLALSSDSRVLCIGTESDTDPIIYRELVGATAAEVRAVAGRW